MKKKIYKGLKLLSIILLLFVVVSLIRPTWTPKIEGENSISELRKVEINGENIQIMIRGCDRNNPILLFVHGGAMLAGNSLCSEVSERMGRKLYNCPL